MTITLDDDAFDRGRRDVGAAIARLRTTRDRADHRVTGLVSAGWRGTAAGTYAEAWDGWREASRDVEAGLVSMAELMDASRDALHATDAAVRSALLAAGPS